MCHDLHHNLGNAHARVDRAVPFGPAHALTALFLEYANFGSAALAVDYRDDFRISDEGRARENLAAVFLDEQHLLDRQLVTRLAGGPVNGDEAARGHLGLTAAVLDDGVHIRHLCKVGSVPSKSFMCKGLEGKPTQRNESPAKPD